MLSLSSAIVVDVAVVVEDKRVPRSRHDWTMCLFAVDMFRKQKRTIGRSLFPSVLCEILTFSQRFEKKIFNVHDYSHEKEKTYHVRKRL